MSEFALSLNTFENYGSFMDYDELFKIILENGFTPEIRKQLEERAYSSKDIADLIEIMAKDKAGHAEIKQKLDGIEAKITGKKADETYITKNSFLYTVGNKVGKALEYAIQIPAEIIFSVKEGIEENKGIAAGVIGAGLLTAAGIFVGSYLAVAEIGALVGGIIPPVVCTASQGVDLDERGPKAVGAVFGALAGAVGACLAYGLIPEFASQDAMNIIGKGVLSGGAGGVVGLLATLFYVYADKPI